MCGCGGSNASVPQVSDALLSGSLTGIMAIPPATSAAVPASPSLDTNTVFDIGVIMLFLVGAVWFFEKSVRRSKE